MRISNQIPRYYVTTALQTMEQAYEQNHDPQVGSLISRAIETLRELSDRTSYSQDSSQSWDNDPHEVNYLNSAI